MDPGRNNEAAPQDKSLVDNYEFIMGWKALQKDPETDEYYTTTDSRQTARMAIVLPPIAFIIDATSGFEGPHGSIFATFVITDISGVQARIDEMNSGLPDELKWQVTIPPTPANKESTHYLTVVDCNGNYFNVVKAPEVPRP